MSFRSLTKFLNSRVLLYDEELNRQRVKIARIG
jgi:hypothetical protein